MRKLERGRVGGPVSAQPRRAALLDEAIDETVLEGLRTYQRVGQPDFPSKIVALYLGTTPRIVNELETVALAGDTSLMWLAAHRLNSASGAVGAVRLATLCHDLEAMARRGLVPNATERIQVIADEYGRVAAALKMWCVIRGQGTSLTCGERPAVR